jgi:hypothetical protein
MRTQREREGERDEDIERRETHRKKIQTQTRKKHQ